MEFNRSGVSDHIQNALHMLDEQVIEEFRFYFKEFIWERTHSYYKNLME